MLLSAHMGQLIHPKWRFSWLHQVAPFICIVWVSDARIDETEMSLVGIVVQAQRAIWLNESRLDDDSNQQRRANLDEEEPDWRGRV